MTKSILVVGFSKNKGGIETTGLQAHKLLKEKYNFDYLKFDNSIAFESELKVLGSKVYPITKRRSNALKHYFDLIMFFYKNSSKYDAIHYSASDLYTISPIVFSFIFGIKTRIVHARNSALATSSIRLIIKHRLNRLIVDPLITKSVAVSKEAANLMFIPSRLKYVSIIKNPFNHQRFKFDNSIRENFRRKYSISNRKVILHVGVFLKVKNHDFIFELAKKMIKKDQNILFVLVGDGPLKQVFEDNITKYGLTKNFMLFNSVKNIEKFYFASDILILPSFSEGFGNVVVEAQLSGLRCIVSENVPRIVSISELVEFVDLSNFQKWIEKLNISKNLNNRDYLTNINADFLDNEGFIDMYKKLYG